MERVKFIETNESFNNIGLKIKGDIFYETVF